MIQPLDLEFIPGQRLPANDINLIVEKLNQLVSVVNSIDSQDPGVTQQQLNEAVQTLEVLISAKASQQAVDDLAEQVSGKASRSSVETIANQILSINESLGTKASKSELETAVADIVRDFTESLGTKVSTELFNQTVQLLTEQINSKPSASELGDYYTKEEVDGKIDSVQHSIRSIWTKIGDMTGEQLYGISLQVNPTYFVGNDGCDVHIAAYSYETVGIFDEIWFYLNDDTEPVTGSGVPVESFTDTIRITDTVVLKCRVKILGEWYERSTRIIKDLIFWIGAGTNYTQVFNDTNKHTATNCFMRGNYDVHCAEGDHIIFIIPESVRSNFQRIDMNGFEIDVTEQGFVDIYGNSMIAFTSVGVFQEGTYNIDING